MALTEEQQKAYFARVLGLSAEKAAEMVDSPDAEKLIEKAFQEKFTGVQNEGRNNLRIELTNKLQSKAKEKAGVEVQISKVEDFVDAFADKLTEKLSTEKPLKDLTDAELAKQPKFVELQRKYNEEKQTRESLESNRETEIKKGIQKETLKMQAEKWLTESGATLPEAPKAKQAVLDAFYRSFEGMEIVTDATGQNQYFLNGNTIKDENHTTLDLDGIFRKFSSDLVVIPEQQQRQTPANNPAKPGHSKFTGTKFTGTLPTNAAEANKLIADSTLTLEAREEIEKYAEENKLFEK